MYVGVVPNQATNTNIYYHGFYRKLRFVNFGKKLKISTPEKLAFHCVLQVF